MPILTIAIPTYNRHQLVEDSIRLLLPQLSIDCELLLIDNHSLPPIADRMASVIAQYPNAKTRLVYNDVNIGGGANILRCFELCETEWMWLLGDDDLIAPDAVEIILSRIRQHPNGVFLNFASDTFPRAATFVTIGQTEFVNNLDDWSHLNLMSVGIYNTVVLRGNLRVAYQYSYSMSPHIALVIATVGNAGECVFCVERIIRQQTLAAETWSPLVAAAAKFTLLELVVDDRARAAFAEKLRYRPSLEAITAILHVGSVERVRKSRALYFYDRYCASAFYYQRTLLMTIRVRLYRFLVAYPRATRSLFKILFPVLQRLYGSRTVSREKVRGIDLDQRL
jgi:glycosyltransferase involved in cell wall biosynthesis